MKFFQDKPHPHPAGADARSAGSGGAAPFSPHHGVPPDTGSAPVPLRGCFASRHVAGPGPRRRLGLALVAWQLIAAAGSFAAEAPALSPETRTQIEALQEEKASRSPTLSKLDSQLVYALRRQRSGKALAAAAALEPSVSSETDGTLLVDLTAEVSPAFLKLLDREGGKVLSQYPRERSIRARVPLGVLETLAAQPEVQFIRPAVPAYAHAGPLTSAGDVAHQADQVRTALAVGGAGIKIGVLSDSADHYLESQARGELPPLTILPGALGTGNGEGTAMMEIIHDLAPDAELYFATAFDGRDSFADNIRRLYAAGCRIIVDDIIYFDESPFQDGPIARAVNDVSAGGALFFSSAGNEGNFNDGTGGTWEGDFLDGGPATIGRGGRLHSFGSTLYNTVQRGGGYRRLDLFWADPMGRSANDYDLYVVDADGNVIRSSTNIQNGQQDPWEWSWPLQAGERIVVVKYSGEARYLHLSTFRGRLAIATPGSTRGHNASGAPNAFSVAAVPVRNPPAPFLGGTADAVETFSSDGPRRIFFHPDGQPITPGNFSSTGGLALQKPDLTAADGVATSVPGFAPFFGTSAAAPHAAAIAALLWSYNPELTPAQIRAALTTGTLDIEAPGYDRDSGPGISMVPLAVAAAPPRPPRLVLAGVALADADASGTLDVNECGDLRIVLRNLVASNGLAAQGVTAVLTSLSPGVKADPAPHVYPGVPPGGTATNDLPFRISSDANYICWEGATLQLQVTAANANPVLIPIQIPPMTTGIQHATQHPGSALPQPIPDLGNLESAVSVTNFSGELGRVTVSLWLQHTYDSDLRLTLVGPDGTEVLLSGNRGGSGEDMGAGCTERTLFTDFASNSVVSGTAPFVGEYRPESPLSVFWGWQAAAVNGVWTLRISDEANLDAGTLECWTLTLAPIVCRDLGSPCLLPPQIIQAPLTQLTTNGDSVQFSATASGTAPLHYSWQHNGVTLPAGAAESTLRLTNVTAAQAGNYAVVLTNFYGATTSAPALLTVRVRPFIIQPPLSRVATNGDTVAFSVVAGGTEPLTFQWFFAGTNPLLGATNADLIIAQVTPAQAGAYSVRVSSELGVVLSADAHLSVLVPPQLASQPQSVVATNGDPVRLEVSANGTAPLGYQWYFETTHPVGGATGPSLILSNITPAQAGRYAVVVSNVAGAVRSLEAIVTVLIPPIILVEPTDLVATNGDSLHLEVLAGGTAPLSYQWFHQETNLVSEATTQRLDLPGVTPAQSGTYSVVVTNLAGSARSRNATVAIHKGPDPQLSLGSLEVAEADGNGALDVNECADLWFAVRNLIPHIR